MPKLKESAEQQKDNLVRAYIAKNQTLQGLTDAEVAIKLHCSRQTYQHKKKVPTAFTLGELRKLVTALKFSEEEKTLFL